MTTTTKQTIDCGSFLTTHRPFDDMNGLVKSLRKLQTVWSWAARAWTSMNPNVLRFRVSGHHHKGYVFVIPNASDLFDVYLTNLQGVVKHTATDVFVDSLVDTIDGLVERIPEYKQ